jgi:hypothetical protein
MQPCRDTENEPTLYHYVTWQRNAKRAWRLKYSRDASIFYIFETPSALGVTLGSRKDESFIFFSFSLINMAEQATTTGEPAAKRVKTTTSNFEKALAEMSPEHANVVVAGVIFMRLFPRSDAHLPLSRMLKHLDPELKAAQDAWMNLTKSRTATKAEIEKKKVEFYTLLNLTLGID